MEQIPYSRIAAALLALLATMVMLVAGDYAAAHDQPGATFLDISPEQQLTAAWALDLFAAAELELPPIDFVGHPPDECHGRPGYARYHNGRGTVHICIRDSSPSIEFLYLHEIAHVWDQHALDDGRRRTFMELRSVEAWLGSGAWHEKGSEQAADILAWALIDRPIRPARIEQNTCAELRAAYRVLTGAEPLNGFTDYC